MTFLIFSLMACNGDDDGFAPFVTLESPTLYSVLRDDIPELLSGTAIDGDSDETALKARFVWSGEVICDDLDVDADGFTSCETLMTEGEGDLVFEAWDPEEHTGSDSLSLAVLHDYEPVVEITSPEDGAELYSGQPIDLAGVVSDDFDLPNLLDTRWESDQDGGLGVTGAPDGEGNVSTTVTLTEGSHTLTLYAIDSNGGEGSDSLDVEVGPENSDPTCEITAPEDGDWSAEGETATFTGSVDDSEQDPAELEATWSSDVDGVLSTSPATAAGVATLTSSTLTQGLHLVSLEVTDEAGGTCLASVSYVVGTPPTLEVTRPTAGGVLYDVGGVTFSATVADEESDPDELTLSWTSDVDGEFNTDSPPQDGLVAFTDDTLSPGDQTLTVVLTDPDGLTATSEIPFSIDVGPSEPTVEITPDPAYTDDDLVAVVTSDSVDPEGNPVTYAYAWSKDGGSTLGTADTLPSSLTAKDEVWEVIVTPNDGATDGTPASATVTILNSKPVIPAATLAPDPGYTGATLACTFDDATDADDDVVQATVSWTVSGSALGLTDHELTDDFFEIGDTVQCLVTPNDGYQDGDVAYSNEVAIENTPPEITNVTITPASPTVMDTLTCAYEGYSDLDGDADESTYSWTVDGTEVGTSETLSESFEKGDEVVCTVTPYDGNSEGTPLSDSVTVGNTAPAITGVTISPDPATIADTLTCSALDYEDEDGDSDQSEVVWMMDGNTVGSDTTLSGVFSGGDTVFCELTAYDGEDYGAMVSTSLRISNTVPTVSSVSITPNPATAEDELRCSWSDFVDPDLDDSDQSHVSWSVNGIDVSTDLTLSALFTGGDTVTCTVTPYDGEDEGTPVSESLVIDNSAPSITSVGIDPEPAYASDTLTCVYGGFVDEDGDADQSTYEWTVNGNLEGTSSTLAGVFVGGDLVSCEVTPSDGSATGTPLSAAILIENSPPELDSVTISPDPAYTDDELTCTEGTATDADGTTSFTYLYTWEIRGVSVGSGDTLASTEFNRDDEIVCMVSVSDGTDLSDPFSSDTLTISNSPPEVISVELTPSDPSTNSTLSATVSTTDEDGDSIALTYDWEVDGSDPGSTSSSLNGASYFDKGQQITVTVTPDDGRDQGDSLTSSTVTVVNTPPGEPTITITPSNPYAGRDDLVCEVDNHAEDVDADTVTYTMTWTVDSSSYSGATTTTWTDDTVPGSDTLGGEIWECTATPNDGEADGTAATDLAGVDNCSSLDFNGSSSYVTVTDGSQLDLNSGNFTVEAWFRLDSIPSSDMHLMSKRDATSGWDGWLLGVTGTSSSHGGGLVYFAHSDATELVGTTTLSTDVWYHVAYVNPPPGGTERLFLDGTEESSGPDSTPVASAADLILGRDSASSSYWFDGQLAEVALAPTELYTSSFTPDDEFDVAQERWLLLGFDEASGSTLEDLSAWGNDGTVHGASWVYDCNYY